MNSDRTFNHAVCPYCGKSDPWRDGPIWETCSMCGRGHGICFSCSQDPAIMSGQKVQICPQFWEQLGRVSRIGETVHPPMPSCPGVNCRCGIVPL